jgi:hypothetical protein
MSYPVVCIFTRKQCGGCIHFMKGYQSFVEDVRKICPEAKVHVITYDLNWTTRIYNENYGYNNLINDQPGPDLDHLEFAPMIAVVRSDYLKQGDKYLANGAIYQPKQRIFAQSKQENLRVWLAKSIRQVEEDIAKSPIIFKSIEQTNSTSSATNPNNVQPNRPPFLPSGPFSPGKPFPPNTKLPVVEKKVENLIQKSKPRSMLDNTNMDRTYPGKSGPKKFHFEMVDTN